MQTLRVRTRKDLERLTQRLRAAAVSDPAEERKVAAILADVAKRGDAALLAYARKFDGFKGGPKALRLGPAAVRAAYAKVDKAFIRAVDGAIANVRAYQERLKPKPWRGHLRPGVLLGQLVRPLRRVGLYVPGGEAPLVSTVIMTAVPARVAGVTDLVLASPARFGQGVEPRIIVAADRAGVKEILPVGGPRPWPPWPTAPRAWGGWTRSWARAIAGWPWPRSRSSASAASTWWRALPRPWCWPTRAPRPSGWPPTC